MNEREQLLSRCDALVDTYSAGSHSPGQLVELRRELAVTLYRLTAFVKQVHGEAGLSYIRRKYAIAREMVAALGTDAKLPMNKAEVRTEALASVNDARSAEVWAEAERESLRLKIDATKQVLQAMQQELAHLAHEARTTHHQDQHA